MRGHIIIIKPYRSKVIELRIKIEIAEDKVRGTVWDQVTSKLWDCRMESKWDHIQKLIGSQLKLKKYILNTIRFDFEEISL